MIYLYLFTLNRYKLEEATNMSTSDHMMFTQQNAPLGSQIRAGMSNRTVNVTPNILEMFPKVWWYLVRFIIVLGLMNWTWSRYVDAGRYSTGNSSERFIPKGYYFED